MIEATMNQVTVPSAKPFVKWAGGKRQLLPVILKNLPNDLAASAAFTYIEPFVGGGAVFFAMMQQFPNIQKAVINDINPNLVRAYRTIQQLPEKLIVSLQKCEKEYFALEDETERKDFYLQMRKTFNEGGLSDVENTTCFIFLNRTCFNGLYRVNAKGLFNVPFGRYSHPKICDAETIMADSKVLQRTEILCGDFEATEAFASAGAFVYLDPPYRPLNETSSFTSYSKEQFDDDDQRRLQRFFIRLSQKDCLLMLSNSDPSDRFFDELYQDYHIDRVEAMRSLNANASTRGKLSELLIRNYQNNNKNLQKKWGIQNDLNYLCRS